MSARPKTSLVYLPGLDGTGRYSAPLSAALAPTVEVITASYPNDLPLDYAELEPLARAFLPTNRDFFLLGESFSGPLALAIAAVHPPGLRGVILACSFARSPLPWLRWAAPLLALPLPPPTLLGQILWGRHLTPSRLAELAATLAEVPPKILRARAKAALRVDYRDRLAQLDVPLLYLRAREDRLIPRAASAPILAAFPLARMVELPGPHFLLQASADLAADAIRAFIEAAPRRAVKPIHDGENTPPNGR